MKTLTGWKVYEWTGLAESKNPIPMTKEETESAVKYLRENNYPKPDDCPKTECPGYRPACELGICYVAIRLCGDF